MDVLRFRATELRNYCGIIGAEFRFNFRLETNHIMAYIKYQKHFNSGEIHETH